MKTNVSPVVVAVVGHVQPQGLKEFTDLIEGLPYFNLIFLKQVVKNCGLRRVCREDRKGAKAQCPRPTR